MKKKNKCCFFEGVVVHVKYKTPLNKLLNVAAPEWNLKRKHKMPNLGRHKNQMPLKSQTLYSAG